MPRIQYPIHVEPVSTSPETVTESRWHQPYSEPRRDRVAKAFAVALIASGGVFNPYPLPDPEPITESRWHQSWSEPVRVKQGLAAWQQQTLAVPVFVPVPEIVTLDKWLYQWADPIRSKPGLAANLQQTNPTFVVPGHVGEARWFAPLSEPMRRRGVATSLQSTIAFAPAFPFQTPLVDQWGTPLSEPIRAKRTPEGASTFVPFFTAAEVITPDKWFMPLGGPIQKKNFPASEQQYLSLGPNPITASLGGWSSPLAEPLRRQRQIDLPIQYTPFVPSAETVTLDKWYQDFNRPTPRLSYAAALSVASFQSNYLVPAPYVDPPMASWSYGLSSPVRLRTGLLAASQTGAVEPVLPQPNPPAPTGVYTVSGLYVIDQFTDNTVVYDYGGGVSHRTN